MEAKQLKKYNIVQDIWSELFGYHGRHKDIDVSYGGDKEIDLTETSGDLDFKVSTFQSRGENVYFNISLFDYDTKEERPTGYFYIKNYTGEIGENELKALSYIIKAGNQITKEIFETIG